MIFYETSKEMSKISLHDLITISGELLLITGQNHVNPKLLQPIVASICKVMTVKKPCVIYIDVKKICFKDTFHHFSSEHEVI